MLFFIINEVIFYSDTVMNNITGAQYMWHGQPSCASPCSYACGHRTDDGRKSRLKTVNICLYWPQYNGYKVALL